jgi:flavin-dependent dehydrogenase
MQPETETVRAPNAEPPQDTCDVFVIGGGPAGSTVAALLAQQGRKVVLVEKSHHPRFHIGESLLPANVALFERLGVREQVAAIGMPKWGIEFVSTVDKRASELKFAEAWDKSMPYSWQVRRSDLDELLFRNAATRGAIALEGCRVRDLSFDAEGATVHAELDDGARRSWRTRFVVDASGRDTFIANKLRCKQKNPRHNSSALFGHFTNAERLPGINEGHISIFWFKHGWIWFIPLADGTTSVGAVCWPYYLKSRAKPVKDFFMDTIAMSPELSERLKNATLVDGIAHATGNYSYSASHSSGERYLMLGDAYAFIDPVFSSGVYLAMQGAFSGAETIATCLDQPERAAQARAAFDRITRRGPRVFSWFIFRIGSPAIRGLFLYPRNPLRVKEAVLSVLAGDIYRRSPKWLSLWAFKGLYYTFSMFNPRRTYAAWKTRQHNIRDMGPLHGETIVDTK